MKRNSDEIFEKLMYINNTFVRNKRVYTLINSLQDNGFYDESPNKDKVYGTVINVDSIGSVLVSFDYGPTQVFELGKGLYPVESTLDDFIKNKNIENPDDFYDFIDQLRIKYPYNDESNIDLIEGKTQYLNVHDLQRTLEYTINSNIKNKYLVKVLAVENDKGEIVNSIINVLNTNSNEFIPLKNLSDEIIKEYFKDVNLINYIKKNHDELIANFYLIYQMM